MSTEFVSIDYQDEIAIVNLNDHKTLNSLSVALVENLTAALKTLSKNDKTKVVILRSTAKIFCAGANIPEFKTQSFKSKLLSDWLFEFKIFFKQFTKPIIAVVNDGAYGGGFELALMCDMIFANKNAKFGFPEIKLGLMPGLDGTLIAKVVGRYFATKIILTGESISAKDVQSVGVLAGIGETNEDTLKMALEMANKVKTYSLYSLIVAKKTIRFSADEPSSMASLNETSSFNPLLDLEGAKEGIDAFVKKRKPDFKGK